MEKVEKGEEEEEEEGRIVPHGRTGVREGREGARLRSSAPARLVPCPYNTPLLVCTHVEGDCVTDW